MPCHRFSFGADNILFIRVINKQASCVWVETNDTTIPINDVLDVKCTDSHGVVVEPIFIAPNTTHVLVEREKNYAFYYNKNIILTIDPCRIESDIEWFAP